MKQFFILLLFLALTVMNGYSQNDWKAGYIIKNSGDSVFGMIDNRDSKANSNHCYFRKDEVSETIQYGPSELAGYRFNDGTFYVSKNIAAEDTIRKLFLEFLIEGRVNVFHYKDEKSHFFIEKEGKLYELKNTTIIKDIRGTKYYIDEKEYLVMLNSLMKDANMQTLIDKSRLDSKSLIKIAKNYHERVCTDEQCIIYEKKIKPIHATLGFQIGESINRFNFGDELISDYGLSSSLGCRVEFENIINYYEKLSLQVDLTVQKFSKYNFKERDQYTTLSYNGQYYTIYDNTYTDELKSINIDLKAVELKLPVVVNYTFSKGKFRPYVGLGVSNTFVLSQNKDFVFLALVHKYNQSIPTYSIGVVGRVGCKYALKNNHTFYSDLNIDYSQNIDRNQFYKVRNNLYSLTVGYTL